MTTPADLEATLTRLLDLERAPVTVTFCEREPAGHTYNIALPKERENELTDVLGFMAQIGYLKMEEVPQIPRWSPVSLKMVKAPDPELPFYDFEEFEQLVEGAGKAGADVLAFVLLAGKAGLRRGEIPYRRSGDLLET